jgi:translation elongation factor EF-Ts
MITDEEIFDRRRETAIERYQRDNRFRTTVVSLVNYAMNKHGPIDPHKPERAAHDIAMDVATILLQTLYEEDGECARLRVEADAYKKIAEESIGLRPMAPMILTGGGKPNI